MTVTFAPLSSVTELREGEYYYLRRKGIVEIARCVDECGILEFFGGDDSISPKEKLAKEYEIAHLDVSDLED